MQYQGLNAFVVFGTDPHLSEYLPDHWKTRPFISGFMGSAGIVIITTEKAALWTDSRYFLQAENELSGTGIELVKMRTPGYPEPTEWLKINLKEGSTVGTDKWCISVSQFSQMQESLIQEGIQFLGCSDLLDGIWDKRPPLPHQSVYEHKLKFACRSRKEKIALINRELEKSGADFQIITALDDLAWTFNLRGNDVECNPVFLAYAIVSKKQAILFIDNEKLSAEIREKLEFDEIQIQDYLGIADFLQNIPKETRILIDPNQTNQAIFEYIPANCKVIQQLSIPCQLKAIKSEDEIRNIRQAMRKDGVAMVEFLYWLENNLGKIPVTEFTIAEKLIEFRSQQSDYKGISFFPIVGYKEHGAIVHFHVSPDNALPVKKDGFLLFDSGGQYLDGTTDITRSVALSELSSQQKKDFTLVLKGMISLTLAKFPLNTRGYHLDILARKDMWKHGLNYGHGTGHGVGYFLNVHEGPMSIPHEFNDRVIEAGMVLSNEPAFYRLGEYGLRTENMIVCLKDETTEFGEFLRFDTLTLCPIDTKAIDKSLLLPEETEWLNSYHQMVYRELKPMLRAELQDFLKEQTKPL
jgi:Xaa-Pro aminopeptidase